MLRASLCLVLVFAASAGADVDLFAIAESMGYNPTRIFTQPTEMLLPGDMVLLSEGVYQSDYALSVANTNGTAQNPIVFAAMPGHQVILDGQSASLEARDCSHIIFDGLTLANSQNNLGQGARLTSSNNITLRNIDSSGHTYGVWGMQDLHDVVIENCVFHHNSSSGVNLGASSISNSDITIRDCLIYNNGGDGIQHVGAIAGLSVDNNVIHSNAGAGISLLEGVCDSLIEANLVFNNSRHGILLRNEGSQYVPAGAQEGNTFIDNIIWIGLHAWNGQSPSPADKIAIMFEDLAGTGLTNNSFQDNILVTYSGALVAFSSDQQTVENSFVANTLFRYCGPGVIYTVEGASFVLDDLNSLAHSGMNTFGWPGFDDVSLEYYNTPERFNFGMPEPSAAACLLLCSGMLSVLRRRRR